MSTYESALRTRTMAITTAAVPAATARAAAVEPEADPPLGSAGGGLTSIGGDGSVTSSRPM